MKKGVGKRQKNRRGLSAVVTTLIIILLVLVAVGIMWVVVRNILNEGAEEISLGKFTLDLEIKSVQVEGDNVSVLVKRNPGGGNFAGMNFVFSDGDETENIRENITLSELEQKRFRFTLTKINASRIKEVSIIPVLILDSGKESLGLSVSTKEISGVLGAPEDDTPPPLSDLIAHWKFDDGTGTSTTDDSGNGNAGILVNGPIWTTGNLSGALQFDGINDYVVIPHTNSFLTDDGTVSFWFKADSLATEQGLWSKDSTDFDTGGHLSISIENDSTIRARLQSSSATFTIFSSPVTANRWYHVAFTFGSGGMRLFLDASATSTSSYTGGLGTTSGGSGNFEPIAIGIGTWQSDNFSATPIRAPFQGIIDDVRIYNRALSASEIQALA